MNAGSIIALKNNRALQKKRRSSFPERAKKTFTKTRKNSKANTLSNIEQAALLQELRKNIRTDRKKQHLVSLVCITLALMTFYLFIDWFFF